VLVPGRIRVSLEVRFEEFHPLVDELLVLRDDPKLRLFSMSRRVKLKP
jgi:hypothetical protein